jgi:phage terminase large subunit
MVMTLQKTTAQIKISKMRSRYRIVQGGTSSSKTFSILALLINQAVQEPNLEISVVAESIPHLKRGAVKDFIKIMNWTNLWNEDRFNKSSLKYKFSNGSYIEFFSADSPDKMRGARRDILFVNEANNIHFETFNQLAIRTTRFVYIDYNPTAEFWAHEISQEDGSEFLILTYKDNEALSKTIVKELEKARERAKTSEYWKNWWIVYGLGQVGKIEELIFKNWAICKSIPESATYVGTGMDFGFTNDPTAVVDVFMQNGELFIKEVIYETDLQNPDIAKKLMWDPKYKSKYIIADSAEPKSIAELNTLGLKVMKCPAKDTMLSIDILKRYKINVTEDSLNLIKEIRGYRFMKDRDGKIQNEIVDTMNHLMDALRYFALHYLGPKTATRAFNF